MDIVFLAGVVITLVTAIPVVMQLRTHPKGLVILFFAEMWERFSYYGMRGLLIFYLTQHFLFDDKTAQGQYGAYTSLVYLLPLVGGFVADRWLGTRKAIAFGALLLVAGHFTMAFEGKPAIQQLTYQGATYEFQTTGRGDAREVKLKVGDGVYDYGPAPDGGLAIKGLPEASPLPAVLPKGAYDLSVREQTPIFKDVLYLALALIIMGVGFLKANISSLVGQLYPQGDPKRDPGFTLYYYGINLGSFWAAIACGWLGQNVGWNWGFGAAGLGMLLGFVVFVLGKPMLQGKGEPPDPVKLATPVAGPITTEWLIYLGGLAGVGLVWLLVQKNAAVGYMLAVGAVAVLGYLGVFMATKCSKAERERMMLALVLVAGSVVFWALFEQAGSSLNQFAERNTDLSIGFGQSITAAQTQSFNAGFILIFAPVFSAIWAALGSRRLDPNPAIKFGLGLLQVAAGFFVLVLGAKFAGPDFRVPVIFLMLAYLLHTTGELCLSPVGLSQMTKLAPAPVLATMMATWFLGTSGAQWVAGLIAQLTATETVAGQVLDPGKALATYVEVFAKIGGVGVAAGLLMLAFSPILKKWAHGVNDPHAQQPEPIAPTLDGERQAVNPQAMRADRNA
ncbi:MAG: MFS transporter [Phenylobacterium sp.]|uniref:peptide MFS transporter n=1 Tax=Phenylobacterium sp. TaxID=1871053 RepID=UPI0025DC41A9|nr:peptide MFS transporter [Phenylobacterium sp.]MBI1200079.1 MFS transporter [Phenylobacterium sp.]